MKKLIICSLMVLAIAQGAWATSYTGSITSGGGLLGTMDWATGSTLSWIVNDTTNVGLYTYVYRFTVPNKAISHVIIEVSPTFTSDNVKSGTTSGGLLDSYSKTGQGNSNPGMPDPGMYGIKWNTTDSTSFQWTIVTDRAPMWGDFYAKDGKSKDTNNQQQDVYAYNTGFGFLASADIGNGNALDPSSGYAWVLVPDTKTDIPVPEPGTIVLLGAGLLGLGLYGRRRNSR